MTAPTTVIDRPHAEQLVEHFLRINACGKSGQAQRADGRQRRKNPQMPADIHRRGNAQRVAAAQSLRKSRNRRQKRGQHDARRAAVNRDQPGHEGDDARDG